MASPAFPVAVVGIGCHFPGGRGPEGFWRLLMDGADAVTEVPSARTNHPQVFPARRDGKRYGGFLGDVAGFDALFFGISPREAERMDPQQRLLLEVAWEALEDAHIPPPALAGSRTGVFVGQMGRDYWELQTRQGEVDIQALTGSGLSSFASGRLSFVLDLRGPSVSLDTACSSSLLAVHLACQSLRSGDCQTALAAGVNLVLVPELGALYEQVRMIASHGRCRFGDASADGFVRSEGVGVVVLRPLDRALANRDRVYAVIAGSAVNNDGRASGSLVAPSQQGQEDVLRDALDRAGVDPADVDYVEAHGTGTRVGDAVELRALSAVLGAGRPWERPCLVGSVKTNLGHTEGAAGIAGFIKTALSVYHRQIPGSLMLDEPNPALMEPGGASLAVPPRPVPWPRGTPVAGVTSFGLSGTNVHVVLTTAAQPAAERHKPTLPLLLPLSARHPAALRELAGAYADRLDGTDAARAARVCAAAARGRAHHPLRATAVADDGTGLAAALRALPLEVASGAAGRGPARRPPRVVFVFPPNCDVPSYQAVLGASRALPAARAALTACDKAVRSLIGWSLLGSASRAGQRAAEPDQHPLVIAWAVQVALAAYWQANGIRPDAVIGYGPGEVAAAQIAGKITPATAACLARTGAGLGMHTGPTPATPDVPAFRSATTGDGLAGAIAGEAGPGPAILLEISVQPVLTEQIGLALADSGARNAIALPECQPASAVLDSASLVRQLVATTARLYEAGAHVDWDSYYPRRAAAERIPTYPWQRQHTWFPGH